MAALSFSLIRLLVTAYDKAPSLLVLHVVRDLVPRPGVGRTVCVTPATHEANQKADLGYTGGAPRADDAPVIPYRRLTRTDL